MFTGKMKWTDVAGIALFIAFWAGLAAFLVGFLWFVFLP